MVDDQKRRVIVVENEPAIRNLIKKLITSGYPDFDVVADVDNTIDALRLIKEDPKIQGVFLDIHFDCEVESNGVAAGFDLACSLKKETNPPWVVFMTARADEYALEAHRKIYGQIGFLDKPFDTTKLDELVEWIRQNKPLPPRPILIEHRVTNENGVSIGVESDICLDEIRYVHVNNLEHAVDVHLLSGIVLEKNRKALHLWKEELAPFGFHKINRSCIVNLQHVQHLSSVRPFTLTLKKSNEKLPNKPLDVPPNYVQDLKLALKSFNKNYVILP